ncbi:MAG: hypothetical protein WC461_01935 [Candidatus Paceibacterota bacterium]
MKKVGVIAMVLGVLIVLGSIGQSDFETLILAEETTPFCQIQLHCLAGLALFVLGLLINKKEVGANATQSKVCRWLPLPKVRRCHSRARRFMR